MPKPTPTEADIEKAIIVFSKFVNESCEFDMCSSDQCLFKECVASAIAEAREEMREKICKRIEELRHGTCAYDVVKEIRSLK